MRIIILLSALFSSSVFSWECGHYNNYGQAFEEHYKYVTDVIVGRVISGEVGKSIGKHGDLSITFDISLTLKGDLHGQKEVRTDSEPPSYPFSLGGYYLVFLYGTNYIDFCGYSSEINTELRTVDEFIEYSKREDIKLSSYFKGVAEAAEKSLNKSNQSERF